MDNLRMILTISIILFISCSTIVLSTNDDNEDIRASNRELLNDMFLPSEGMVHGLPDYVDWKFNPRIGYGINPPPNWTAILAWGQVYAANDLPNPDEVFPDVRVQIKDLQLFIYQTNGTWTKLIDAKNLWGAMYVEDFINDAHKTAEIRNETGRGGGISVKAGSGYNFHFGSNRVTLPNRNKIAGVFVVCQARLIGTENYPMLPKYLLNVGGDYWRNLTASWNSDYSNNNDIAIGRFKYVTPEWQYFTMHTFSKKKAEQIILPIKPIAERNN